MAELPRMVRRGWVWLAGSAALFAAVVGVAGGQPPGGQPGTGFPGASPPPGGGPGPLFPGGMPMPGGGLPPGMGTAPPGPGINPPGTKGPEVPNDPLGPGRPGINPPPQPVPPPAMSPRFNLTIDPKATVKDLLPKPPTQTSQKPSAFVDDLAHVPELMLHDPIPANDPNKAMEAIAHQVARINHLNARKKDRFLEALLAERTDLAGLPFAMGEACRMPLERSRHFTRSVAMVHNSVNAQNNGPAFLQNFTQACLQDDENLGRIRPNVEDHVGPARVAAMTQICTPASEPMRLAMTKYVGSVSRTEATQALARIVLFSPEEDVRAAALSALKARKEKDYTDTLLSGFRYPWPEVAKRAADAIVKLDRKDLIPQVIKVLEEPDPRAPVIKKVDGQPVATVRELVRINHHRNCLMCHAPGQDVANAGDVMTAEVPVPGQSLPSFSQGGYRSQGIPELLVRIDVTYLRQDFSVMLPVENAAPWPELQRFDFVTRTRVLGEDGLKQYREKFDTLEPGVLPPNHKAALVALRELTGKDTTPTAEAWRKLLNVKK